MSPSDDPVSKRSKKACTQCRQQKARCDAHLQDSRDACSRCTRMGLTCVIDGGFEREHKRRKMYQLQRETQQLRDRIRESSGDHATTAASSNVGESESHLWQSGQSLFSNASPSTQTLPRMIDGLVLESDEIDHLFQTFWNEYAASVPLFDSSIHPNGYFHLSPCLFWAIIAVASRKYNRKPELVQLLLSKTIDLVLLTREKINIHIIEALLLLVNWQFPRSTKAHDSTFLLNGTLLHMGIYLGLHTPTFSQEFSKDQLDLTPEDIQKRASLWALCVTSYQRSCVMKGSPSMALADIALDPDLRKNLLAVVPLEIKLQLQVQDVVIRCSSELARNGLRLMSKDQERGMDMIVSNFLRQLDQMQDPVHSSSPSSFMKVVARLVILSFYFYQEPMQWTQNIEVINSIISNATQAIEWLENSDSCPPIALPWYFLHSLLSANAALIRIHKTPSMTQSLYERQTLMLIHRGIALLKQMSVDPADFQARADHIFTQLLSSSKAFIHPDSNGGQLQGVPLRVRTRLAMSHVLDGWIWWSEEFRGSSGAYPTPPKKKQVDRSCDAKAKVKAEIAKRPPQTNGMSTTRGLANLDHNDPHAVTEASPLYPSNAALDELPFAIPDPLLQADYLVDIWTYWPDEDWGIPGLS